MNTDIVSYKAWLEHQSFQSHQNLQLTRLPNPKQQFFKLSVTDSKFCRNKAIGSRGLLLKWNAEPLRQGYSNGGPRSESGPLDGDGRILSAS